MTEDFLHYIWRCGLFYPLTTNTFQDVEVISTGQPNPDAGPDFFNAIIRIEDIVMAGNVEIHINASDWFKHGHHKNRAYDNVIIQLVLNPDTEISRINGEIIPTAVIRFDKRLYENYKDLLDNEFWIPCEPFFQFADMNVVGEWLEIQALRRIEQKVSHIGNILYHNRNDWQESFYQLLARNFGFRLNGAAFEMLARSLPFKLLLKHRDNLLQLEALLFGQAGMLQEDGDDYYRELKMEYLFLRRKYGLKPHEKYLWKYLRLRPANFPTLRIAQFASFIHQTPGLFATIMETRDIKKMKVFFEISAARYWNTHYVFNKPSAMRIKTIGKFAVHSIIVNTVAPLLYFYGKYRQMPDLCQRAIEFLKNLPPETNSVVSKWNALGVSADSAFISQALLQQKNEYCFYKKCLHCSIGIFFIKNSINFDRSVTGKS